MPDKSSFGSGNGSSPVRRQAITWTNAELLCQLDPEEQTSVEFQSK